MDKQFDSRALLSKLQGCLSDNDRRRLHFIVRDTIPRHLRDDPTLDGTLNLLETLFDQATISEQDFDYLIEAFREINCYDAVNRLKQHQLSQHLRNRVETSSKDVSSLFANNQEHKISYIKTSPDSVTLNNSKKRDSQSSQTTILSNQQNAKSNKLSLTKKPFPYRTKVSQINMTFIKQKLKSRLTICQLILLLLNIIGIIIFILLIIFFIKSKRSNSDILLVKTGNLYGNIGGGSDYNDAQECLLTFSDKIVSIHAGWTADVLDYIIFIYSNGKSKQHGRETYRYSPYTSIFDVNSEENINGVIIYTDIRSIPNPYVSNGSYLVVGLRFHTNKGRYSDLFGSSKGTKMNETFPSSTIAYIRGRAFGYLDAIQFTWYQLTSASDVGTLSAY